MVSTLIMAIADKLHQFSQLSKCQLTLIKPSLFLHPITPGDKTKLNQPTPTKSAL